MLRRAPGPLVFGVRAAAAVGSVLRPRAFYVPRRGRRESPLRSRHKKPRPARPRGASPGRATCGAAAPLPGARRPPGARRRRGSASSSGRPWRPWLVVASLRPPCYVCAVLAAGHRAAPAGRAAASARPRVARMSRVRMLGGQANRTGAMRAAHLRRSALHATMMARGTETRSSQYCERSRRARLAGRLRAGLMLGRASGDDAIDATRRQTRQARSYSSRVERQLDVHEPVNVVRHRRHAAPRREGRPGNDVDRAAAAPALLVVRVRLL